MAFPPPYSKLDCSNHTYGHSISRYGELYKRQIMQSTNEMESQREYSGNGGGGNANKSSQGYVESTQLQFTTELTPDDILFGRGAPTFRHPGNVRFRNIVKERKAEYVASSRHEPKKKIAQEIINEVIAKNGRFLREVKTSTEATELGIPPGIQAWVIVGENEINAKVKQSLREGEHRLPGDHDHEHEMGYDISHLESGGVDMGHLRLGTKLKESGVVSNNIDLQQNESSQIMNNTNENNLTMTSLQPEWIKSIIESLSMSQSSSTSFDAGCVIPPDPSSSSLEKKGGIVSIEQEKINLLCRHLKHLVNQLKVQLQQLPLTPKDIDSLLQQLDVPESSYERSTNHHAATFFKTQEPQQRQITQDLSHTVQQEQQRVSFSTIPTAAIPMQRQHQQREEMESMDIRKQIDLFIQQQELRRKEQELQQQQQQQQQMERDILEKQIKERQQRELEEQQQREREEQQQQQQREREEQQQQQQERQQQQATLSQIDYQTLLQRLNHCLEEVAAATTTTSTAAGKINTTSTTNNNNNINNPLNQQTAGTSTVPTQIQHHPAVAPIPQPQTTPQFGMNDVAWNILLQFLVGHVQQNNNVQVQQQQQQGNNVAQIFLQQQQQQTHHQPNQQQSLLNNNNNNSLTLSTSDHNHTLSNSIRQDFILQADATTNNNSNQTNLNHTVTNTNNIRLVGGSGEGINHTDTQSRYTLERLPNLTSTTRPVYDNNNTSSSAKDRKRKYTKGDESSESSS